MVKCPFQLALEQVYQKYYTENIHYDGVSDQVHLENKAKILTIATSVKKKAALFYLSVYLKELVGAVTR